MSKLRCVEIVTSVRFHRQRLVFLCAFCLQGAALDVHALVEEKSSHDAQSVVDLGDSGGSGDVVTQAPLVVEVAVSPPHSVISAAFGIGDEAHASGGASGDDVVDGVAGIELIAGDSPGAQVCVCVSQCLGVLDCRCNEAGTGHRWERFFGIAFGRLQHRRRFDNRRCWRRRTCT